MKIRKIECSWSAGFLSPAAAFDPYNALKIQDLHTVSACVRQLINSIPTNKHEAYNEPHRATQQKHTCSTAPHSTAQPNRRQEAGSRQSGRWQRCTDSSAVGVLSDDAMQGPAGQDRTGQDRIRQDRMNGQT